MYSFQKSEGEGIIGWNEVIEKMIGGEAKVKDVCAACNNGVLSDLDAYGKQLLVNSRILIQNFVKRSVSVRYEYSTLLRWLLKISYNSSRTDGAHAYLFDEHVPFILGSKTLPPRSRIALVAYLAAPELLDKSRITAEPFVKVAKGSNVLNPFLVRISYGLRRGEPYTLRVNIFGPIVFYLLMFDTDTKPGHAASATRKLLKMTPGAQELSPTRLLVELNAGPQTWLDLYEPQIHRTMALRSDG